MAEIMPADNNHLTLDELAKWLRCSMRTVQRLLETGDGPPVIKLSERRLIFRRDAVTRWLDARTRGASVTPAPRRRGRRSEPAPASAAPAPAPEAA